MTSLLITGAQGLVGRALLNKIPTKAYEKIFCLCRSGSADQRITASDRMEFVRGSLPFGLEAYEQKIYGADTLVHLAAITGKAPRDQYFQVNVEGTRALLEMCRRRGISKFLFVSSIAARFADRTYYYAQSKRQAEDIVRASGLRYTILRPTIVLGPHAPVWQGLRRLARFPVIPVFGDGRTTIQPIWVDDLAAFIVDLLQADRFRNETLEVGGPESVSIEEFLVRASQFSKNAKPRTFHLPLEPLQTALSWLEPLFLPILPLTAGQLASFRSDGTPKPNALFETGSRHGQFRTIDQMLSALCSPNEK